MAGESRGFAGARATIKFDGQDVGWAQGVTGTMTVMATEVERLGNYKPDEIELLGMRFSVQFNRTFIYEKPLQLYGIWPDGKLTLAQFINWPGATIEVFDEVGDKPIVRMMGAKPSGTSTWRVDRQGLASEDASYACTDGEMLT